MVTHVDDGVRSIAAAMEDASLWQNTLLFACSDNGGDTASGASNYPWRGSKFSPLEGGTRVPAFFYSPSESVIPNVNRGQRSAILAHITDLHPTLLQLVGSIPGGTPAISVKNAGRLDGIDIWPQLISSPDADSAATPAAAAASLDEREILYNIDPIGQRPPDFPASCLTDDFGIYAAWFPHAALRIGRWKLVWCSDATRGLDGLPRATGAEGSDHYWLYDLEAAGPTTAEIVDHSHAHPERVERMKRRLEEWQVEAMMPPIQGTPPTEEDLRNAQPAYGLGGAVLDWPIDARGNGGSAGGYAGGGRAML